MKIYLDAKYKEVIASPKYLVAIGDIPIALIAHLDTVYKTPPHNIYYDRVKNTVWGDNGLGADDRAGVFAILELIKRGYRPTIIFTTDEEVGCHGAEALVSAIPEAPTAIKYIIQIDRHGSHDCVFYSCHNYEFTNYIESFGFSFARGSFTDITIIGPAWGVACVNLSIGYYDEHSYAEILHPNEMYNTIIKIERMLKEANEAPYFDFPVLDYPTDEEDEATLYGWDPAYGISKDEWLTYLGPKVQCVMCGEKDYAFNYDKIQDSTGEYYICPDCNEGVNDGLFKY